MIRGCSVPVVSKTQTGVSFCLCVDILSDEDIKVLAGVKKPKHKYSICVVEEKRQKEGKLALTVEGS